MADEVTYWDRIEAKLNVIGQALLGSGWQPRVENELKELKKARPKDDG